jgi:hypothetical protein
VRTLPKPSGVPWLHVVMPLMRLVGSAFPVQKYPVVPDEHMIVLSIAHMPDILAGGGPASIVVQQ